jgi:NitT/TauT family transport system substrate-binding protein
MIHRAALGVILLAGSVACTRKPAEKKLDVVKIADRGFITNAPLYIADEEGFFAKEGIRLEYTQPPRSTSQTIPLLARGDLDVVTSSLTSAFFSAIEQGAPIRIVADRGHITKNGCEYSGIMARRGLFDKNPPSAATLRGKRMSLGSSGTYGYIADNYLGTFGLSTKDIDVVRLGENVEAQALDAGTIDLLHVAEPYLSKLRAQGHTLIGPSSIYSPGTHLAVVEFGPTLTVNRRDVAYRFIKAYLKGVKQSSEGMTARNLDILARRTKLDPEVLRKMCRPAVYADGHIDTADVLKFQQWAVKTHRLDRVLGADAGIDMSFAERAARELGLKSNE